MVSLLLLPSPAPALGNLLPPNGRDQDISVPQEVGTGVEWGWRERVPQHHSQHLRPALGQTVPIRSESRGVLGEIASGVAQPRSLGPADKLPPVLGRAGQRGRGG